MPASPLVSAAVRARPLLLLGLVLLCPPAARAESPEAALKALTVRFGDPKAEREPLRRDLLAFQRTHFGTPQVVEAAELLSQLKSPLDKLEREAIPAVERFDWQPKELVAVLGEHRGRHGGAAMCVAYSPDGKTVVSGGSPWTRVWNTTWNNTANLRQRGALGYPGAATVLLYIRDGKTLVVAGSAGFQFWDMSDPEKPKGGPATAAGTGTLYALALSPNGKLLAVGGTDTMVRLFDLDGDKAKERKDKGVLGGHSRTINGLSFSPDSRFLASGSDDGQVRVWDVSGADAEEHAVLAGHDKGVQAVAFSPLVKPLTLASAGVDGTVRLWDLSGTRPAERAVVKLPGGYPTRLAFTQKGRVLATAGSDGTIRLWNMDVKEPKSLAVLEGHAGPVYAVAFAADGRSLASGSSDCTVRLWDQQSTGKWKQRFDYKGHLSAIYAVAISPDGQRVVSGGQDLAVRVWQANGKSFKEQSLFKGDGYAVYAVALSPDGKLLASGGGPIVHLYDPVLGRLLRKLDTKVSPLYNLSFTPDGQQLAGSTVKFACLWDVAGGGEVRRFEGSVTPVGTAALTPDGRWLLGGSGGYKYDAAGQIVAKNGVLQYEDCTVRIWDTRSGAEVQAVKDFTTPVGAVAVSPDGKTAFCANSTLLRLFDLTGGVPGEMATYKDPSAGISRIAVAPDGKSVATVGGATVTVWDPTSGRRVHQWALQEYVHSVAFASDSRHLLVGLGNGPVYVLRLAELKQEPR